MEDAKRTILQNDVVYKIIDAMESIDDVATGGGLKLTEMSELKRLKNMLGQSLTVAKNILDGRV